MLVIGKAAWWFQQKPPKKTIIDGYIEKSTNPKK
jgi:hypothetical protein